MELSLISIIACIALLVIFDFTNGFHDTANMVATVVACHAMTPTQAIMLVSFFTFLRPVPDGTAVANTVGGFAMLGDLRAVERNHHSKNRVAHAGVIARFLRASGLLANSQRRTLRSNSAKLSDHQ